MKKITIITALVFAALAAFAQGNRRDVNRIDRNATKKTVTTTTRVHDHTPGTQVKRTMTTTTQVTNNDRHNMHYKGNGNHEGHHKKHANYISYGHSKHSANNYKHGNHGGARYKHYYHTTRVYRPYKSHHVYHPRAVEYRRTYHPYRKPVHVNLYWTPVMHKNYSVIYPEVTRWHYHRGAPIYTVSAYNAYSHVGEIRQVYGRAEEVFYSPSTDEYYLYFGEQYPYHDFSVVVPGHVARRHSARPGRYFRHNDLLITGLVTLYDNKPEIVVRRSAQINIY